MTDLSPAAHSAIEACIDENCGDDPMPSEIRNMAAAFRAVALHLNHDCRQLLDVAAALESLARDY